MSMSTDCGLIVKAEGSYYVYDYIKWDGYPSGRGVAIKDIVDLDLPVNRKLRALNSLASEYCNEILCESFEECKRRVYRYVDYIYYADLDEGKTFVVLNQFLMDFDLFVKFRHVINEIYTETISRSWFCKILKEQNIEEKHYEICRNLAETIYGIEFDNSFLMETE